MGLFFACFLCLFILVLARILHKFCWTPIHLQYVMRSQGIKGPSYKFIYGNTKEILNMKRKSMSSPMDLSVSHDLLSRIQPHFHAWIKLYGKNFLVWTSVVPQLVVTEPELIREILSNKDGVYRKIELDSFGRKLLGDGLVMTEETEKWLKLRKLANHAFHSESLKDMVPSMIESVETMLEKWRFLKGKEVDVYEEFRQLTSEIISRTAFGSSYTEGKNIFDMLTQLGFYLFKYDNKIRFLKDRKYFRSADEIETDKIEQSLRNTILSIVRKREDGVVKIGKTEGYGNDFLGSLMKVHHETEVKSRISIDNIVDECKTFYLAGHETISSALTWTLLLLAIHTDWQEQARNEVFENFGQENPKPECIAKLKKITMIINETLRLYAPVNLLVRKVKREVKLGKLKLPAGIEVHIPTYALHCSPEIWGTDSLLFKPERFAEGVAKATNYNTAAFLPFGYGPRTCVGLNFATNEVKIAVSMILQRFKFCLSPSYVHSPMTVLTIRPQQGLPILFHPL